MRFSGLGGKLVAAGVALAAGLVLANGAAEARSRSSAPSHGGAAYGGVQVFRGGYSPARGGFASSRSYAHSGFGHRSFASFRSYGGSYGGGGLQCVPFARDNTGIELSGNAATWWAAAQGVYERGAKPEVGSVLNFRANGRMHMGHVAVVSNVLNARTVEIDHANWSGRGSVTRDISVVDVSPNNDWTAVRVALGRGAEYGSVYPTYGFIYDRPDRGTMVANAGVAPAPVLNPAPADLRSSGERLMAATAPEETEEVAEAADAGDDAAPRSWRRVGRHLVRVHSQGVFHGRPAPFGHGGTVGHAALPGHAVPMGRPAQVVRIQAAGHVAPARHHGRA